jgi:hypothetical protein
MEQKRRYWVVSPNVRYDYRTVSDWRQASVKWKAAFMGWAPNDPKHTIGSKFANVIQPNDIILIARRHHKKPEVVGFGVVLGRSRRGLKGLKPPQSFGSLRRLSPFVPLSESPPHLPLMDILNQIAALHELHPGNVPSHRKICEWMERRLLGDLGTPKTDIPNTQDALTKFAELPHEHELEYEVRTRSKIMHAQRVEAQLVRRYQGWLLQQGRKLVTVRYKNIRCDAYEKKRRNLVEAKCSPAREYIRMAVGQLLDYAFQGRKSLGQPNLAILLPKKPGQSLIDWLADIHIDVIWEEKHSFLDNANGRFT